MGSGWLGERAMNKDASMDYLIYSIYTVGSALSRPERLPGTCFSANDAGSDLALPLATPIEKRISPSRRAGVQ
jgi:hypothetical protein